MNLDESLGLFITESRELLEGMETALLTLHRTDSRAEQINAIFRAVHTIKGSSGLFGLNRIVSFTHIVESVLDRLRSGQLDVSPRLVADLLSCRDHMSALTDAAEDGTLDSDASLEQAGLPLLEALHFFLDDREVEQAVQPVVNAEPDVTRCDDTAGGNWHISLRFGEDALRNGMDPLSFIRYLGKIGSVQNIITLADALPPATEMDPESCYLGFEISLQSDASKAEIEDVFSFVREDCQIRILPPHSHVADYVRLMESLPEENSRLGEILVRCGALTQQELNSALAFQEAAAQENVDFPVGEILIGQGSIQAAVVDAALTRQQQVRESKAQESRSIRVDADKLDHLINLVGELIISAAGTDLVARRAKLADLQECTSTLTSLVEQVRDSALQLRMIRIGATFNRFQRVVHDVSREIGKDIALVVHGEDTELDKTVVEKIADPLTHLVRNAMDHGIEPAEARIARGKPATGTVTLNAFHDSGSIVIEVSDDGGGLKRERILAKAVERGLVEAGSTLTDGEVYALIFEPGFSTAEQVTNLSGRGVGMDVVKRNITALRGTVDIRSEEGVGTTVSVRLPLTLAIIDGFLVGLGKSVFVVPLDMIEECIEFSAEPGKDYANLRGQILPFIRLHEHFNLADSNETRRNIVVVKYAGRKVGLVVDTLLGEFQTVIKPMGKMFGNVRCISGSTILGSGEVALILDVPALLQQAGSRSDAGDSTALLKAA